MVKLQPARRTPQRKLLAWAITLFVALDLTVLAANVWLSRQIAEDAVSINLAGRQRMLSQRMMKSLLLLDHTPQADIQSRRQQMAELRETAELFHTTLHGLQRGGTVRAGNGVAIAIKPAPEASEQRLIQQAQALWQPYYALLQTLLGEAGPAAPLLAQAIAQGSELNLKLLDQMNRLTTELEISAVKKANRIRIFQSIAFSLALLNFFGIIMLLGRRINLMSQQSSQLLKIIQNVDASILVCDAMGKIQIANQSAAELFGYSAEALTSLTRQQLLFERDGTLYGRHRDGSTFRAALAHREFMISGSLIRLETVSDITLQSQAEEHLSRMAYHDALTGLPNRLLFVDRLQQGILNARRRGTLLAVLFIDLDRFKPVNDSYGHGTGDLLLKEIALRLRNCLREEDTVSRYGGDEFAVLLPSLSSAEDSLKVAHAINSSLAQPFAIGQRSIAIGASIGIALHPQDGDDELTLLEHADQAMYQAKRGGGHACLFYLDLSRTSDT